MTAKPRPQGRSLKSTGNSICAIVGLVLISAIASAQTTQPAPQIRVATRLIQVNVIVSDKRGNPVAGLTRDDFVLLDQGEPQKVAFFSEETDHPSQPPAVPAAPNIFSNNSQVRPGASVSATVILLDSLNTGFLDMGFARERVIKFLQQVHPEDRIALYALSDKLLVLHDFTQDTKALLAALDAYKNKPNVEFSASDFTFQNFGDVAANDAGNAEKTMGGRPLSDFKTVDRVSVTAAAFQAIANHLAEIPGRKNLVWVSGSFPTNIGTLRRRGGATKTQVFSSSGAIQDASRALNNGDLAIYPVDARGDHRDGSQRRIRSWTTDEIFGASHARSRLSARSAAGKFHGDGSTRRRHGRARVLQCQRHRSFHPARHRRFARLLRLELLPCHRRVGRQLSRNQSAGDAAWR